MSEITIGSARFTGTMAFRLCGAFRERRNQRLCTLFHSRGRATDTRVLAVINATQMPDKTRDRTNRFCALHNRHACCHLSDEEHRSQQIIGRTRVSATCARDTTAHCAYSEAQTFTRLQLTEYEDERREQFR